MSYIFYMLLQCIALYCVLSHFLFAHHFMTRCNQYVSSALQNCTLAIGNLKTKVRKNCRYVCLFTWVRGLAYSQGAQDLNLSSKPYLQL